MHEPQLALAALPEPPVIFRLRLLPYSIGHELHLWRRKSPLLSLTFNELSAMEVSLRRHVLMQAVHVCQQSFRENLKPVGNYMFWYVAVRFFNLNRALAKLWNYIQNGHSEFEASLPNEAKGRLIGAPPILRLYQFISEAIPEREIALYCPGPKPTAWDFPMALATMLMQARDESEGGLSIRNFQDVARDEYVTEMDAKEARGEVKWPTVKVATNPHA